MRDIDLNLLTALDALLQECSVTSAQAPAQHLRDELHPVAAQGGARRSGLGACTDAAATGWASVRKDSTAVGSAAELGA